MVLKRNPTRLYLGLGALGFVGILFAAAVLAFLAITGQQRSIYPGSEKLTADQVFKLSPFIYYRQVNVYLTEDYIPFVSRWYANRFGMSPDAHGQNNCLALYTKSVGTMFTKVMQVKVCDTINGRMIFDERSIQLK